MKSTVVAAAFAFFCAAPAAELGAQTHRERLDEAREQLRQQGQELRQRSQDTRDHIQSRTEELRERSQDTGRNIRRQAGELQQQGRSHVQEWNRQNQDRRHQQRDPFHQHTRDFSSQVHRLQRQLDAHAPQWIERASPSVDQALRSLDRIAHDPARLHGYAHTANTFVHAAQLAVIRKVPVVDPSTGQIVTFDTMARRMTEDLGIGGSLGEDPVGAAYMMMVDSDFLLTSIYLVPDARSGHYLTIEQALHAADGGHASIDRALLLEAQRSGRAMQASLRTHRPHDFAEAARSFSSSIGEIRKRQQRDDPHLRIWAGADRGVFVTAAFFQNQHRRLSGRLAAQTELEPAQARIVATAILAVLWVTGFVLLLAVLRSGHRKTIRQQNQELERLKQECAELRARLEPKGQSS